MLAESQRRWSLLLGARELGALVFALQSSSAPPLSADEDDEQEALSIAAALSSTLRRARALYRKRADCAVSWQDSAQVLCAFLETQLPIVTSGIATNSVAGYAPPRVPATERSPLQVLDRLAARARISVARVWSVPAAGWPRSISKRVLLASEWLFFPKHKPGDLAALAILAGDMPDLKTLLRSEGGSTTVAKVLEEQADVVRAAKRRR